MIFDPAAKRWNLCVELYIRRLCFVIQEED